MGLMWVLLSNTNDILWSHLQVGVMQPVRGIREFLMLSLVLSVVNLTLDVV